MTSRAFVQIPLHANGIDDSDDNQIINAPREQFFHLSTL